MVQIKAILSFARREAVLCVSLAAAGISMLFVPPSLDYFSYIDLRVLSLLFSLMAVVAGFRECGLFSALAGRLLAGGKSMRALSVMLVLLPFFGSMLVTNDVALLTFVPFAATVMRMLGRGDRLIYIIVLQTLAANLGSMATPVGNPQNLYIYGRYALSAGEFYAALLPFVLLSLAGLTAAAALCGGKCGAVSFEGGRGTASGKMLALFAALFALCLLTVFRVVGYELALCAVLVALLCFSRHTLLKVDYCLLITFVCFFIFSGNMGEIPAVRSFLERLLDRSALLTAAAASQVISNVPAAVLLSHFTDDWRGLLLGVDIGGLGTPVASLASLISLKLYLTLPGARPVRFLAVFTLANLIGLAILLPLAIWLT